LRRILYKDDFRGVIEKFKYKTVFDKKRGYMRIDPYPTQSELKEYYEGDYFNKGGVVKHDYLNDEIIYQVTYLRYIDSIFNYIKNNNVYILEYGCGVGSFIRSLLKSNFLKKIKSIEGVDISNTAIRLASDHTNSHFTTFNILDNFVFKKYDIIISLEVIEHIPNVHEVIQKMSNSLNQDGLIFITTPNYNSFEQRVFKENWRLFCPPEHINYFTKNTLIEILVQNGLEILQCEDEFVYSLSLGIRKKLSNTIPFLFIKLLTKLKKLLIYKILNRILRVLGFEGGKITIIAKKILSA